MSHEEFHHFYTLIMDDFPFNFLAELYFLISKFLSNGPLKETAKVLNMIEELLNNSIIIK